MEKEDLLAKHCVQYPPETPNLTSETVEEYMKLFPLWNLTEDRKSIFRQIKNADFLTSINLTNKIAKIAEEEQHHPDLKIYSYKWLEITLSTHVIGGLSENDYIMAAKIDELLK